MWNIRKVVSKGAYNYALVPEHPNATQNGYVLEHRIVVENSIGRLLGPGEIVHHINSIKKDNRIENLEITSQSEHASHHGFLRGKKYVLLKCPSCGLFFEKPENKTHLAKGGRFTACSGVCRGKFSAKMMYCSSEFDANAVLADNVVMRYKTFPLETELDLYA